MAHEASPFRSILVPLDGSVFAEQAVPLARRIAERGGGKLRLALVHELPSAPLDPLAAKMYTSIELVTRKAERGYLRQVQAKLREGGTRPSSAVTMTGTPGPALTQYVQELGMDLVVMATHGRGGVRRAWLGSVADYLIRNLNMPVLLVRPREGTAAAERSPAPSQILVPLDGSPLAEEAVQAAAALARILDLEVSLAAGGATRSCCPPTRCSRCRRRTTRSSPPCAGRRPRTMSTTWPSGCGIGVSAPRVRRRSGWHRDGFHSRPGPPCARRDGSHRHPRARRTPPPGAWQCGRQGGPRRGRARAGLPAGGARQGEEVAGPKCVTQAGRDQAGSMKGCGPSGRG